MSIFSSYKKIFLLGFIIVILVAIPLTVYIAQKRQNISSKATASTTLSFEPASSTIKVGDTLILNIMLDPGTGASANLVSFVKLAINFDSSKFATVTASLENTLNNNDPIDGPTYEPGKASISLSIGANPANAIKTKTKIAILKLKATDTVTPTAPNITFDFDDMQVLSIDDESQTSDNVLLSTTDPATITVTSATTGASPTSTPTPTLTEISASPTSSPASSSFIQTSTPVYSSPSSEFAELNPTIPIPILTPTLAETETKGGLAPTGPGEKILGIGILGAILTIIGGALLIFL